MGPCLALTTVADLVLQRPYVSCPVIYPSALLTGTIIEPLERNGECACVATPARFNVFVPPTAATSPPSFDPSLEERVLSVAVE